MPAAPELGAAAKVTQSLLTGPSGAATAGHGLFENGSVPPSPWGIQHAHGALCSVPRRLTVGTLFMACCQDFAYSLRQLVKMLNCRLRRKWCWLARVGRNAESLLRAMGRYGGSWENRRQRPRKGREVHTGPETVNAVSFPRATVVWVKESRSVAGWTSLVIKTDRSLSDFISLLLCNLFKFFISPPIIVS